jgi:hypothetical protein
MKPCKKCLVGAISLNILLFLCCCVPPEPARTCYYVSVNGDDANPGTEAHPWKTLAKAASSATQGVTIYVRQGMYNERLIPTVSGTAENPIVFTAYPGEYVTITGEGMSFPPDVNNCKWCNGLVQIDGLDYLTIQGFHVTSFDGTGILVSNSSHIKIAGNYTCDTYSPGIIDSCINNGLYWDPEGMYETSWESRCSREAAA